MTTQHGTDIRHSDSHEEVWKLLPWYVNGTLNTQEVEDVEVHLAACPVCQTELARCRDIAAAVRAAREDPWVPSPPGHFN